MKLVYLQNARMPTEKAHGLQIAKMCEAYARLGHTVELWVPRRSSGIQESVLDYYGIRTNFHVRYISGPDFIRWDWVLGSFALYLQQVWFAARCAFLRIDRDAVVYTRSVEIAWLFARRRSVIFEAHYWPGKLHGLYRRALRFTRLIVCNSRGTEEACRQHGLIQTIVAPNGVDLETFQPTADRREACARLGLPVEKKIAMYVGGLFGWKGIDTIIAAAKQCERDAGLYFVIIGGTGEDVKRFQRRSMELGISNIMICPRRGTSEIPWVLQAADVLLLPNIPISVESERYTSPIKVFEYMASRRPIVASDLSSIREILNEKNSILVAPGDASALIHGIIEAVDPLKKNVLVEQAWQDVQRFTWLKRAERVLCALSDATLGRP